MTLSPTDYQREIVPMLKSYFDKMKAVSNKLARTSDEPQLDVRTQPLGFYLTDEDLARAKEHISTLPGFEKYLMLFGLERSGAATVCMVGADRDGQILEAHKINNAEGEETWLKTTQTLAMAPEEHDIFIGR